MSELYHYGMPRRSGRYPWGSGEEPFQHNGPSLMARADEVVAAHPKWTPSQVAEFLDMSRDDYLAMRSAEAAAKRNENRVKAYNLRDQKGLSNTAIAEMLGVSEGTVRNYFKESESQKERQLEATMDVLRKSIKEKGYVDVSDGAAERIGLKESELKAAYMRMAVNGELSLHNVSFTQLGTGNITKMRVVAPVDATPSEVRQNKFKIKTIDAYVEDETRTLRNIEPPINVDPKRIKIRYGEEGGLDKDGVIEIRKGVKDLDLGNASYAQVRIAVNGTHYLKGMAIYGEDMPKGCDIIFNTNKHSDVPMLGPKDNSVLKPLKTKDDGTIDFENPFGATIKTADSLKMCQRYYTDSKGKKRQSAINVVNEEGDWDTWSKTLSSQFLSKQPAPLIKRQLDYTYNDKKAEFEEIKSLTNPIVRKHLLANFAESCDSDAVSLKASSFPRQTSKVILPLPKMSPTEVYAPGYKNGEKVVLVRYPHAATFEIPELRVNNNVPSGKRLIGETRDAIGIHPKVAQRLSGADFDGDSVVVIPVSKRLRIQTEPVPKSIKDFEPKEVYKGYPGMKKMTDTQMQMGRISNLITDMQLKDAPMDHIVRAVKHSMVVIDAEKHGLDYQASEKMNGIAELRKLYQDKASGGASTLISRAGSPKYVNQRKPNAKIDKKTGEKIYFETHAIKWKQDKDGNWVQDGYKKSKTTKMADAKNEKDVMKLLSEHPNQKEMLYANYAVQMKKMANEARREALAVPSPKYNKTAARTYAKEVASIDEKVLRINKQKPLERQAQLIANDHMRTLTKENPSLYADKDRYKKAKYQALEGARHRVGKGKLDIEITDREWEAIQAGAVRIGKARTLMMKTDSEKLRERAMPRQTNGLSNAQVMRIKNMSKTGQMTQEQIANTLGVSISTVRKYV